MTIQRRLIGVKPILQNLVRQLLVLKEHLKFKISRKTVVSVSLKLNENGYPEIDSKFGNSWKPAEQITETPKVVKEEAPKEESNETDEIPF